MTRVVISFLGFRSKGSYDYCFPNGGDAIEAHYSLPAVLEWLKDRSKPVDQAIVMGVPTSAWADLTEQLTLIGSAKASSVARLDEAELSGKLAQDLLDDVWRDLPWKDVGKAKAVLLSDPEGSEDEERNRKAYLDTLQQLQEALHTGESIVLDLSQGIRHQPLIALLAAIYLRRLRQHQREKPAGEQEQRERQERIEHIFSASVQRDKNGHDAREIKVRDLSYLLVLADWIFALGAFNASGNVGELEAVLKADGNSKDAVKILAEGAALERATRFRPAAEKLRKALAELDLTPDDVLDLKGAGGLFADELTPALAWARKEASPTIAADDPELARRARDASGQTELGRWYLDRGDFVRAATYLFEAAIDSLVARGDIKPNSHRDEDIKNEVNNHYINKKEKPYALDMFELRTLRNLIVHANDLVEIKDKPYQGWQKKAHGELVKLLDEPAQLGRKLNAIADNLFGPRGPLP